MNQPPPIPAPASNVTQPTFPVAVAGRFTLFFLWLLPGIVAVCLYYLLVGIAVVMGYAAEGRIDTRELLLVLAGVFGVIYIPALLILTMITTGVTRISSGSGSRKKKRFLLHYFLVNLVLGPIVLCAWWFVTERM